MLKEHIAAADPDAPEGCDKTKLFDAIAFPDEGASKRFGKMFPGFPLVVCGALSLPFGGVRMRSPFRGVRCAFPALSNQGCDRSAPTARLLLV
jgi:hypothetical protein